MQSTATALVAHAATAKNGKPSASPARRRKSRSPASTKKTPQRSVRRSTSTGPARATADEFRSARLPFPSRFSTSPPSNDSNDPPVTDEPRSSSPATAMGDGPRVDHSANGRSRSRSEPRASDSARTASSPESQPVPEVNDGPVAPAAGSNLISSAPASGDTASPPRHQYDPETVAAWNRQALAYDNLVFPGNVVQALGLDDSMSLTGTRLAFTQFRQDAGGVDDPVERVLLDQLHLAHLVSSKLHADAEKAKQLEFKKLFTGAAARLMTETCRTAEAIMSIRASRGHTKARPAPSQKHASTNPSKSTKAAKPKPVHRKKK